MSAFSKKLRVEEKAHKATKGSLKQAKQVAESKDRDCARAMSLRKSDERKHVRNLCDERKIK